MGLLNGQHCKSIKGSRQQADPLVVELEANQKNEQNRSQLSQGGEQTAQISDRVITRLSGPLPHIANDKYRQGSVNKKIVAAVSRVEA